MDTLENDRCLFDLGHTLRKYPTAASGVNMLAGLLTPAAGRQRSGKQHHQQRDRDDDQRDEDQRPSVRHAPHRAPPLCTNRHKIKPGMRDGKYPRTPPSRGPRTNSRAPKDPPTLGTLPCEWSLLGEIYSGADLRMNEAHLASAILAITFAAVMLVAGQLFIEYRASKYPLVQAVKTASLPL
ncbi:hypothetical protein [Bradyrhizobium sp. URHD0069]|uniref:hypothetical protein n=1 Tax=Bradyrhizobium sp. URHD0069 TaxID=1380355 RepID=UPI0012DD805A|nr:hypothetical protein [Bradyrhizobium sp. URHD0069]